MTHPGSRIDLSWLELVLTWLAEMAGGSAVRVRGLVLPPIRQESWVKAGVRSEASTTTSLGFGHRPRLPAWPWVITTGRAGPTPRAVLDR